LIVKILGALWFKHLHDIIYGGPWIPAFAGMTRIEVGMARIEVGMTRIEARVTRI
jgi:hypothetical protein